MAGSDPPLAPSSVTSCRAWPASGCPARRHRAGRRRAVPTRRRPRAPPRAGPGRALPGGQPACRVRRVGERQQLTGGPHPLRQRLPGHGRAGQQEQYGTGHVRHQEHVTEAEPERAESEPERRAGTGRDEQHETEPGQCPGGHRQTEDERGRGEHEGADEQPVEHIRQGPADPQRNPVPGREQDGAERAVPALVGDGHRAAVHTGGGSREDGVPDEVEPVVGDAQFPAEKDEEEDLEERPHQQGSDEHRRGRPVEQRPVGDRPADDDEPRGAEETEHGWRAFHVRARVAAARARRSTRPRTRTAARA